MKIPSVLIECDQFLASQNCIILARWEQVIEITRVVMSHWRDVTAVFRTYKT